MRVREVFSQRGPSLGLDAQGDPLPVRQEVGYEVEVDGFWQPIDAAEAQRLLREGRAQLVR